jgi:D-alanyl-D-alanine carboxypeptidase
MGSIVAITARSLAGYVETKSGRKVVVMIAVGDVPIATSAGFLQVTADQAKMIEAVQQDL